MNTTPPLDFNDAFNAVGRVMLAIERAAAAVSSSVLLPGRRVLSAAGAVYDCEMVSCSLISVQTGFPEPQASGGGVAGSGSLTYPAGGITTWSVSVEVAIVRCANEQLQENGEAPLVAGIQADLANVSSDLAVLIAAARRIAGMDQVPAPHSVRAVAPQGKLLATVMTLTIPLWDLDLEP